jgi:hypothetical protein
MRGVLVCLLVGCCVVGAVALDERALATCMAEELRPFDSDAFWRRLRGRVPFVTDAAGEGQKKLREEMRREALLGADWREVPVLLSSANSYSQGRRESSLGEYIEGLRTQELDTPANASWYLFGDTRGGRWDELEQLYALPGDSARDDPMLSIGIGGKYSGVSFHTHGPAWGETVIGRKVWFFAPPDERPSFHPNESMLAWTERFLRAETTSSVRVCTVPERSVIYVPSRWWHSTLNLDDYNAFVSTFTREEK